MAENLSKKLEFDIEAALLQSNQNSSGLSLLVAALDAKDLQNSKPLSPVSSSCSDSIGADKKRKISDSTITTESYWERRKRNNEAAKKSREKRRLNDLAMESRLLELSRENSLLRSELLKLNPIESPLKVPSVTPSLNTQNLPTLINQLLSPTTMKADLIPMSSIEPNDLTVPGRKRAAMTSLACDKPQVKVAQGRIDCKTPQLGLALLSAILTENQSKSVGKEEIDDDSMLRNCLSTLNVVMSPQPEVVAKVEDNSSEEESQSDEPLSSPNHWDLGLSATESTSSASPSSNGLVPEKSDKERYVERRKRNNEAAKRCRANRRVMYEFRTKRIDELQRENVTLKEEVLKLSRELLLLKNMVALRQASAKLH